MHVLLRLRLGLRDVELGTIHEILLDHVLRGHVEKPLLRRNAMLAGRDEVVWISRVHGP
jgi:hypothetical protein